MAMSLDRESNKTLRMVLRADDGGQPKRSDQSEVEFVLTDVNDNAPVIRPQKSVASVFEVQTKEKPTNFFFSRKRLEFLGVKSMIIYIHLQKKVQRLQQNWMPYCLFIV